MLGWEYPPHVTGGLAAAAAGIVQGVRAAGHEVILVLPESAGVASEPGLRVVGLSATPRSAWTGWVGAYTRAGIGSFGIFEAVDEYTARAPRAVRSLRYDVIHAHDWLTAAAAQRISAESRRPWLFHVHATEYDRAGPHGHPRVVAAEQEAVRHASLIVAVSRYTRRILIDRYGAQPGRVEVVHNSVVRSGPAAGDDDDPEEHRPMVLFLGRLVFQKGPDYFVEAAMRVVEHRPDVLFVVAGEGDMKGQLMQRVASLGLGRNILFTGWIAPDDTRRLFAAADLFVMPSVSEPFGIAALEAIDSGVPVIISRGSGVREVVRTMLEVDFWDVEGLAAMILSVLTYHPLRRELEEAGHEELGRWSWDDAGAKVGELYRRLAR